MHDPTIKPTNPSVHAGTVGLKPLNIAQARKKIEELTGRNITVIADDSFLLGSKDSYPPLWAAREVVQNFGDHNVGNNKGTLNGVQYATKLLGAGKWKFTIRGNWLFNNPDSLMHLGSEGKGDEDTGGNGIGLKQVVVRSLRDWGVSKFQIQGNGWNVIYSKLTKEQINGILNKAGFTAGFDNDLIIAEMESAEQRDYCKYIIETSNSELANALGQIKNIGVANDNPYLQNPDYKNDLLIIKWLFPDEQTGTIPQGRLFMGCQVAGFKRDRKPVHADYWGGLMGCTIAIKTPQKKSVDRPPLDKYSLETDLEKPVASMTKEDIIAQLKKSEPLWSSEKIDDEAECFVLIKRLVYGIAWGNKGFTQGEFEKHFGERKYLADELFSKISTEQREELRNKGYLICPHYFSEIGMPTISSVVNNVAKAVGTKPDYRSWEDETRAEESGLQITYTKLKIDDDPEAFFKGIKAKLGEKLLTIQKTGDDLFEIHLGTKIQEKDLTHIDLSRSPVERLKDLHFLRSIICHGLSNKFFKEDKTAFLQGKTAATFIVVEDQDIKSHMLYTRVTKECNTKDQYLQVQVNKNHIQAFEKVFCDEIDQLTQSASQPEASSDNHSDATAPVPDTQRKRSRLLAPLSISLALLGLATGGGILGLILALRSDAVDNAGINTVAQLPQAGHSTTNTGLPKKDTTAKIENKPPKDKKQAPLGWDNRRTRETEDIIDKFLESKDSNSKRVDGVFDENNKHLRDIAGDFNKADIKPAIEKLEQRIEVEASEGHRIENFKIVQNLTRQEISKINLLRRYIETTISTGVGKKYSFENDIGIFTGDGTRGLNYRGLILLHQELLKPGVKFEEALSVTLHELTHESLNSLRIRGHGREFISMLQSLNAAVLRGQGNIAREVALRLKKGESLSEEQLLVTNAGLLWKELGK